MTQLGWLGRKTSTQTNKHILKIGTTKNITSKQKSKRFFIEKLLLMVILLHNLYISVRVNMVFSEHRMHHN